MSWHLEISSTSRPSSVLGGAGALAAVAERSALVAEAGIRLYVITDENVVRAWGGRLFALAADGVPEDGVLVLPPGEGAKDGVTAMRAWEWLARRGARRDDVVVAFGGGVVGDLAGFVASTYLRGVRLWQLPTTLLAQVDSSVGGKVAINLPAGKNLVGAFYQPELVVADQQVLSTLPPSEMASGLGEVVKYGLLSTEGLLDAIETGAESLTARDPEVLSGIVARCVSFKAAVVEEDEHDRGRRAILNLGHTVGHALEAVLGYGTLSHGAAVGLGLLCALAVSEVVTGLPPEVRQRTEALLGALGLPTRAPAADAEALLAAMRHDKKTTAEGLGFVCLQDVGRPVWGVHVEEDLVRRSLEVIRR